MKHCQGNFSAQYFIAKVTDLMLAQETENQNSIVSKKKKEPIHKSWMEQQTNGDKSKPCFIILPRQMWPCVEERQKSIKILSEVGVQCRSVSFTAPISCLLFQKMLGPNLKKL